MFFKDSNGINTIQMGKGDVAVSEVALIGVPKNKCVGILFAKCRSGKIDRPLKHLKGKKDFEIETYIKILFTNPKSIDVVIKELKQAKKIMLSK